MTRHTSLGTMLDVVPKLRAECPESWILRSYRFRAVLAKDIHHFDKHRRHGPLLLSALWKQFQKSHSLAIGNYLRSWKPDDFAFREYAYAILCLASRTPQNLRVFDSTRLKRNIKNRWFGYVAGNDPNSRVTEMIPDFGIGCHLDGVQPGSAPASNVYWFEGVLVVLVAELGRDGDLILFENGLSKVLETAQRERRSYFNAVLLSIEDVILIRVFPNGYVELTEAYNLMNYNAVDSRDPVPFHVCNLCYVREGRVSNDEQETSQWVQTRFPPATEGEQKRQMRTYTNSLSMSR